MNHRDASEIVAGKVLLREIDPRTINITTMLPPYSQIVRGIMEGDDMTTIIDKVGIAPIQAAEQANLRANKLKGVDWVQLLHRSAVREEAATIMYRLYNRLKDGEEVDYGRIANIIDVLRNNEPEFVTAADVDPKAVVKIITGYLPIDYHLGGIPDSSLILLAGPPGTGKTTALLSLATASAKSNNKCAIYSLEMTNAQLIHRLLQVSPDLTMEERRNIILNNRSYSVEEIESAASRLISVMPDLKFIAIDFADMLVADDDDERQVSKVYRSCARLATMLGVPVILLAQLNRNYVGGIPKITDVRFSSLAEALGALIILIYNPHRIWTKASDDVRLKAIPGVGYMIIGKARYGYGRHSQVGAIQIPWKNENGSWAYDTEGNWFDLGTY